MSQLPTFFTDNLDDVVFEGRNQAYGAYQLRQDYQRRLASASGITVALCAFALLSWAAWRQLAPTALPVVSTYRELKLIDLPAAMVIEQRKLAVQAPPRARAAVTHPAPTIPTEVVKNEVPPPRITSPAAIDPVDEPAGPADPAPGLQSPTASTKLAGTAGGAAEGPSTAPASNDPFRYVEKMPEFAGGQAALLRYLQSHLRYPSAALAAGVGGKVFMSFVIGADGAISEVTILKGLGYGLDEEAQRVVRQMPAWTPGYQSKHAVAVRFTLPITFSIQ